MKVLNRIKQFENLYIPVSESGCWLWIGAITNIGYGKIKVNFKTKTAHRYSFELFKGPIPENKLVLHSCDIRSCVNPNHLRLGTQSENIKEMYAKGRGPW